MRSVELPPDIPRPAFCWIPEHVDTGGGEVADFSSVFGFTLDPVQRFALDMMYAERADRSTAAFEVAMIATRQNLKTYTLEAATLADVFLLNTTVAWTAHRMRTTTKAFWRLLDIIDSSDHLRARVKKVSRSKGEEFIETLRGGRVEYLPRTNDGARGLTSRKLILDEALMLTDAMMGTIVPIMLAMPDPQIIYASSAGKSTSHVLRAIRDRGRRGGDPELAYLEYADVEPPTCAEGDECRHLRNTPGCCLDDPARRIRANASYTYGRVSERSLTMARKSISDPKEFARECLGWWDDPVGAAAITDEMWKGLGDPASLPKSAPRFALDVARRSVSAAIVAASYRVDGKVHAEITSTVNKVTGDRVMDHRPGVDWLLPRLRELAARWPDFSVAVAAGSPAEAVVPDLEKGGIKVDLVTKVNTACGLLWNKIKGNGFRHINQPALTAAASAAHRHEFSFGSFRWAARTPDADLTPLYAATWATYQLAAEEFSEVSVHGADLDLCDRCGENPHDDPTGEYDYLCPDCREETQ